MRELIERPRAAPRPPVAVVDSNPGARVSTCCLLESEGYRAMPFATADDFVAATLSDSPICVLLDIDMPGRNSLDILRQVVRRPDCPPILVASTPAHPDFAETATKLGAAGFVGKPYTPADLLEALARLVPSRRLGWADAARIEVRGVDALTPRQRQVLEGIVRGRPNKIIAWELQLSVRTVEAYRAHLYRRLGIRSVAEAVRIALAAGVDWG